MKDIKKIINANSIKIIEEIKKEKEIYFNQIYEKTGIKSKNNLVKNLNMLVNSKILLKRENRSNTFYSINYEHETSIALLHLIDMMKFSNLPFERKKPLKDIIIEAKPLVALLFGSSAKENFKEKSDIDLLLVYRNMEKETLKIIKNISERYGILINPVIITLNELKEKNDALIHILKTGYPLVGEEYFYNEIKKI